MSAAARALLVATACLASSIAPAQGADMSNPRIVKGPLPDRLGQRLDARDRRPLPDGAFLRFQLINRGMNPTANYRWLLYDDGRLFVARHSPDASDWRVPFDTELPKKPTAHLTAAEVKTLRELLTRNHFAGEPPYQHDTAVEDGGFYVVTARLAGHLHEIIFDGYHPPLVDELLKVVER